MPSRGAAERRVDADEKTGEAACRSFSKRQVTGREGWSTSSPCIQERDGARRSATFSGCGARDERGAARVY